MEIMPKQLTPSNIIDFSAVLRAKTKSTEVYKVYITEMDGMTGWTLGGEIPADLCVALKKSIRKSRFILIEQVKNIIGVASTAFIQAMASVPLAICLMGFALAIASPNALNSTFSYLLANPDKASSFVAYTTLYAFILSGLKVVIMFGTLGYVSKFDEVFDFSVRDHLKLPPNCKFYIDRAHVFD